MQERLEEDVVVEEGEGCNEFEKVNQMEHGGKIQLIWIEEM